MSSSSFLIPATLQDLEREPYNLLPYPLDFEDDDEGTRSDSFEKLVRSIEDGNRVLAEHGADLFSEEEEVWMDGERMQALYTLVRKSSSLSPKTRERLVSSLCKAEKSLKGLLSEFESADSEQSSQSTALMPRSFRDAFFFVAYMLYSLMVIRETEAKHVASLETKKQSPDRNRSACARAMLSLARTMSRHKSRLWKRGVPEEEAVTLPCRIAYQMMENGSGALARKAACVEEGLGMIAATVDSFPGVSSTLVAALLDMLHSYEHMGALVAELCEMTEGGGLGVELLREIGRLDVKVEDNLRDAAQRANGVKNVALFLPELSKRMPLFLLANISCLLPHLDADPYYFRSAIVTSIAHICMKCGNDKEDLDEEEERSNLNVEKGKDALLDILTERAHDKSSFTRVAVLKAWAMITENQSLPLNRVLPMTALAIDRLRDKKVNVRKNSMQLLTLILENNPFSAVLDPEPYDSKIVQLEEYLLQNIPSNLKEGSQDMEQEDDTEKLEIQRAALAAAMSQSLSTEPTSEAEKEFLVNTRAYQFTTSTLAFIQLFKESNAAFESMLLSANDSDVMEALRFFVIARHFQLPCAVTGMKRALSLMWSTEQKIKDEVKKAFVDVFIAQPGTNGEVLLPENDIARNLLMLAGEATISELASIEEAIQSVVKNKLIPAEVFLILWSIAANSSGEARSAAVLVVSMGAKADPDIVDSHSRLRLVLEYSLGDYTEENRDWKTVRSAAMALQQVRNNTPPAGSAKAIVLELIAERLCYVIVGDWCRDEVETDTTGWFCAAEEAINAIFVICSQPDIVCADIIKGMEAVTFASEINATDVCSSMRLSRFFFVLGHIALKLLVYTEILGSAVRAAAAAKSLSKQISADHLKASKASKKKDSNHVEEDEEEEEEDAIEAELGLAAEAEAETEKKVAEICEKEIVGRGPIGLFAPILVRVVDNQDNYSSPILMQTATLALCKFMCISRSFCEKHLPLLFTALAEAPALDTTLRANAAVALGDLAFRFPNEVEPYTPRMYALLRDVSPRVRRHTLMVLTHLILNDMIKVKGQVCEIALCLEDDEVRIRDMARLLFTELSKRSNNPVYNLLPDIISRMSKMNAPKKVFRGIVSFLLKFIQKEHQNATLADKLCHRFPTCTSISQKADIAFCISQLKINAKIVKTLNDLFKLYKDALFDKGVYDCFASLVAKAKKKKIPEAKELLEEWEGKLKEENSAGMEDEYARNKAKKSKGRAAKRANRNLESNVANIPGDADDDVAVRFAPGGGKENLAPMCVG